VGSGGNGLTLSIGIVTVSKDNLSELKKSYQSIQTAISSTCIWVVVDGNSQDGTADWLKETVHNLPNVIWISEPDSGIYDAMNKGIQLCEGRVDYVLFLNAGDRLTSPEVLTSISATVARMTEPPTLITGASLRTKKNGRQYLKRANEIGHMHIGNIGEHQAMFFRYDVLDKFRYRTKFQLSADYDLVCRIGSSFGECWKNEEQENLITIPDIICEFTEDGISESKRLAALKEDYQIRREVLKMGRLRACILYLLHWADYYRKRTIGWMEDHAT
jgi:putative colanic acid biosynthesis glycosyltransferase